MEKMAVTAIRCIATERWLLIKKDDGLWCFPEVDVSDAMYSIGHAVVSCLSAIGEIRNITLLAIVDDAEKLKDTKHQLHMFITTFDEEKAIDLIKPYKQFMWMHWEDVMKLGSSNVSVYSDYAVKVFEAMLSDG